MTKISIVIPCFNSCRFIGETLESIRRQTHEDIELIISDGGSDDSTIEIIQSYSFSNIKIISKPDRGVAHALNRGFRAASGDVLCWLNSDDVYMRSTTLALVAKSFRERETVFAYGHCMTLGETGAIDRRLFAYVPLGHYGRGSCNIFTGSLFFSRSAWKKFGGFSENYRLAFEYELLRHLFDQGRPELIDEFLAAFRIYPSGLSSKFRQEMRKEKSEIFGNIDLKEDLLSRLFAHAKQGTLVPLIMNRVWKKEFGVSWEVAFR